VVHGFAEEEVHGVEEDGFVAWAATSIMAWATPLVTMTSSGVQGVFFRVVTVSAMVSLKSLLPWDSP